MPKRKVSKASAIAKKERRRWHYEHVATIERCLTERRVIVIGQLAQFNPRKLQAERGGGTPRCLPLIYRQAIPEHGRGWPVRKGILDELNPLCCQFDLLENHAGNIAGGARQVGHVAASERIVVDSDHHDR